MSKPQKINHDNKQIFLPMILLSSMTQEKKKILYIITKGNFGGAQRYVFDLATHMINHFNILVATGEPGLLNEKLDKENIPTISLSTLQRDINFTKDIASVREIILLLIKEKPHIIHINSSKAGFSAGLAGRIYNLLYSQGKKVNIIFTCHGWAFKEKRSLHTKIFFYIIQSLTVLLSHVTICVSQKSKEDLSLVPVLSEKMIVIHNGIAEIPLFSQKNARHALDPLSPYTTWIGTLSELHTNKGLDIALEALAPILKSNKNIGFYIAGRGEEESHLKQLSITLGIKDQVCFLGYVQNAQTYLKAFDIFTLTSRTECLPYVLIEAGFAKTSVIASSVGGVPEIVENLHSGMLVHSEDPEELKHAITYALDHKKDIKKFGQNLYTKVSSEFSIEKMIKQTLQVYTTHTH